MEHVIANEGLGIAINAAGAAGVKGADSVATNTTYSSIIRQLKDEAAGGNEIAGSVYNMVLSTAKRKGANAAIGMFGELRGKLGEIGDTISTNAAADAANAVNNVTYEDVSGSMDKNLVEIFKNNGAGKRISRADAAKVFKNMADYYAGIGNNKAADAIRKGVAAGDFGALSDMLRGNVTDHAVAFAFSDVTFSDNKPKDVSGSRRRSARDATADLLGLSDASDSRDRKKDWQSLDARARRAATAAFNKYNGSEDGVSGDVILAAAANDKVLATEIVNAVKKSGGTITQQGDTDTETVAGMSGKAAVGDMFNGEMVSIDAFTESVKNVGDKADITTEKLEKLGTKIQEIVDKNESGNVPATQAVLDVALGKSDADVKKAGEALSSALLNPTNTPEQNEHIVTALGDLFKQLFSALPIQDFINRLADAVGSAVGNAVGGSRSGGAQGGVSSGGTAVDGLPPEITDVE